MTTVSKKQAQRSQKGKTFARVIPCNTIAYANIGKWLFLGWQDMKSAPFIAMSYGLLFAAIPWFISYLVSLTGQHLVILPALVCFVMLGPVLAAGLYDVSWELEKGHLPSFRHSAKAMSRNSVNEWAFALLLLVIMIFWLRIASLIHALYPPYIDENFESLLPFLTLGTLVGVAFTGLVFFITAFTQPVLMERRVDLATAVMTSINAVKTNFNVMMLWAGVILLSVLLGFATFFVGFVFLMPLIGFASWHAYIDTIAVKKDRHYE